MEEHADLDEVPEFTVIQEEHFKPKCAGHPNSSSPRSITDRAVLSKQVQYALRKIIHEKSKANQTLTIKTYLRNSSKLLN